ncbi:DNA-binding transcriptional regulator YbjK [Sinosporangium album]|uniref:DNA-binding transcriptional regulator YbjK n=1 Tax=Sinosporangium album TaxID=504805 RepID=A0A1G8GLL2_9ACTN|nr:TetR/AcrR family transcriptional regulator [Sinosporangium album]SDH95252.1 DNA-binding transcriptional regulator YbjK [Sinosporangium album]
MSKTNDQISKGATTKARLRTAAAELIAEVGWRGVSTRMVADRAGLRVGLVHYHFDSLTALLLAAVMPVLDSLNTEVERALRDAGDAEAGMRALAGPMDRLHEEAQAVLDLRLLVEVSMEAARDPDVAQAVAPALARARAVIAEWLSRAGCARDAEDAAALAAVVMAAADGLVLHRLADPALDAAAAVAKLGRLIGGRAGE